MILEIFILGILFMLTLLYLGASQSSFGMLYLGFFVMLLLGLFMMNDGLSISSGLQESPIGSGQFSTIYKAYTPQNDPMINVIAHTFFYLPIGCIVLTTLIALRR